MWISCRCVVLNFLREMDKVWYNPRITHVGGEELR